MKNEAFWRLGDTLGALGAHSDTGARFLTIFWRHFGDIWSPLAALGPLRGPHSGHFSAPWPPFRSTGAASEAARCAHPVLPSPGDEKVRFLGGPDVAYIW